jgi:hypothetical protein
MVATSQQVKETRANEYIQRHIRGILARKEIAKMREEEMIFLGMVRRPQTAVERANDPLVARQKTRDI